MAIVETPEGIARRIKRSMNSLESPSNIRDNMAEAIGKEISLTRNEIATWIDLGHDSLIDMFNRVIQELRARIEELEKKNEKA